MGEIGLSATPALATGAGALLELLYVAKGEERDLFEGRNDLLSQEPHGVEHQLLRYLPAKVHVQ
jgi:hypothetical protein